LDCAGLCWIGPLALMGIMQWAASGGHPSNRAKAPPLAPSTWNRNPCWVVLRVSHRHVREASVGCEWRLPIHSPRAPPLASGLSQDVPEPERCDDD
jgi:hypothetical protein